MKKTISFVLALTIILGSFGAVFADETVTAPVPKTEPDALGMYFTGEEIKLSLDDALKIMTTTGPAYDAVQLTKKGNDAAARGQFEFIEAIEEIGDQIKAANQAYGPSAGAAIESQLAQAGMPTSMNSLTGKQAELAKTFYRTYSPVAYEAGMNGIKNSTIQAYFGLLMTEEAYNIAKETCDIKETLYKNTQRKFQLGVASKMEVLLAESDYLSAQQKEMEALATYNTTKMSFNMAMNFDLTQNVTLTDKLEMVTAPAIDIEKSIESALTKRNELIKAKYDMDNALLQFNSVKAYPRNSATYMGGEAGYKGAELAYRMQLLTTELGLRQEYMSIQNLKAAVASAEKVAANAKEAARLSQLQYDAGMCTMTDLQTAQNNSAAAQLGVVSAIMNYNIAVYSFDYNSNAGIM
ncbi:MAG: TolC family protein [Firmicutes bacterium]|nr:TolC family protein [Bacillota bacterium]